MSLVELARYPAMIDAEIACGRLRSEGIHAVCFDSGMNIAGGVGSMIPVRLMVLAEDRDEALALLREAQA